MEERRQENTSSNTLRQLEEDADLQVEDLKSAKDPIVDQETRRQIVETTNVRLHWPT